MGWLAIMRLASHSQTWGVNAQLLLRSASYEESKQLIVLIFAYIDRRSR
jgi:hypothetical protein